MLLIAACAAAAFSVIRAGAVAFLLSRLDTWLSPMNSVHIWISAGIASPAPGASYLHVDRLTLVNMLHP